MAISYRLTSGAALVSLTLPILDMVLPPAPLRLRSIPSSGGAVGWDPCTLVAQPGPMYKLIAFVWFGAYVVFILKGLRNRSGPRWLGVAGILALPLWIESDWWRVSAGCVSNRSVTILLLWAGIVALMFLHHVIRPSGEGVERDSGRPPRWINTAVVRVLVFMPIGWSVLNAIRPFDREPALKERAIVFVQRCFSWATLALFLVATALSLIATVARLRASMRPQG
uniref:Transmembrane protein n=1 Tax=Solibacter usitatus (strain Ellin6076) TaxID=234267 RepID=Q01TR6_SOLUE